MANIVEEQDKTNYSLNRFLDIFLFYLIEDSKELDGSLVAKWPLDFSERLMELVSNNPEAFTSFLNVKAYLENPEKTYELISKKMEEKKSIKEVSFKTGKINISMPESFFEKDLHLNNNLENKNMRWIVQQFPIKNYNSDIAFTYNNYQMSDFIKCFSAISSSSIIDFKSPRTYYGVFPFQFIEMLEQTLCLSSWKSSYPVLLDENRQFSNTSFFVESSIELDNFIASSSKTEVDYARSNIVVPLPCNPDIILSRYTVPFVKEVELVYRRGDSFLYNK